MEQTQELLELNNRLRERQEELLRKHYNDNKEILENAIAWQQSAATNEITRAALYSMFSKQGNDEMSAEERAEIISESIFNFVQILGAVSSPKTPKTPRLPLVLFPFQKKLIKEIVLSIERGTDILIEKSREMGVSWTVLYVFVWYWFFKPGSNFLIGSYKEALVSNGTEDSMFGKLTYIMNGFPDWIMPKGFKKKLNFTRMSLYNPQLDCYITGDTMNANFGRGSRKTAIFFDELGFWDYGKAAWESSSQTTSCRIGNSTPNGYNYYKMLIDSGLPTIRLHWSEHPLKDNLWYEYQKKKETKETVAQEVDISYDASRIGIIYNSWINFVKQGSYPYNPDLPLYVSWDFGRADGTAIIWSQVQDGKLRIIDAFYKKDRKNIDFFVPLVTGQMLTEYQYSYTDDEYEMIAEHSRWKKAVHFGDPAGNQKHMNQDLSVIETLKVYGINVNVNYNKNSHNARQSDAEKLIMRGIEMNQTEGTKWLDISMKNYSFAATTVEGVQMVKATAQPKHDQYSHMATAFEYLAVGLMSLPTIDKKNVYDKQISRPVQRIGSSRRLR